MDAFPLPAGMTSPPRLSYQRPLWLRRDLADADGSGVRIALVDSGIDGEWKPPGLCAGIDLTESGVSPIGHHDLMGHGTACASVLWSLAPQAEIYPVRIFDHSMETRTGTLVQAIEWAAEHRMQVVNLSLGTVQRQGYERLYMACEQARRRGLVLVAAVETRSRMSYPAVFDNTIGVDGGHFVNGFAFRYRSDDAVEAIAQGCCRVRTVGGRYRWVDASSFAAPHLSAIVALLKQRHPEADLAAMHDLLSRYAVPGTGSEWEATS